MENLCYSYAPLESDFLCIEKSLPQGYTNRDLHVHHRDELLFINTSGSIRFISNGICHTIQTPAVIWNRTGIFHETIEVCQGDLHCWVIYWHKKLLSDLPSSLLHMDFSDGCDMLAVPLNRQQIQELTQLVTPMQSNTCPAFQQQMLLLCLFYRLSRWAAAGKQVLRSRNISHYVFHLAYQLQDLSCEMRSQEEYARQYFVGKSKLNFDFKKVFGMSILAYRHHVQLQTACALLRATDLPLKQIASECGFSDDSYFNRVFHKHCGISPGTYRKKAKQQS